MLFFNYLYCQYFGRILASETLSSFSHQYSSQLHLENFSVFNFSTFENCIIDIIKNSIIPVLKNLQQIHGIEAAFLEQNSKIILGDYHDFHLYGDEISIMANYHAMIDPAEEIRIFLYLYVLYLVGKFMESTSKFVISDGENTLSIYRFSICSLLVKTFNTTDSKLYKEDLDVAVETIQMSIYFKH